MSDGKKEQDKLANKPLEKVSKEQDKLANKPLEKVSKEQDKLAKELDEAREKSYLKKLEAALFLSGRWLSIQELITLTDLNPILIRQIIEKLIENYDKEEKAIQILSKEDNWKMDVKQEYTNMINKLVTGNSEFTKSEQETLAVVAYKQPIKQSVLVKIRGNKAYEHVRKFIEIGLIKGKKFGRTKELNLSEEFHDYFKLGKKFEEK